MRRYLVIGVLLFVALLVWRLPLAWASGWLPAGVQCDGPSGSIWSGRCDTLNIPQLRLRAVSWRLAALPLLHGEASAQLRVDDTEVQASADGHWHLNGDWQLRALRAELPLEHPLLLRMAPRNYRGTIIAELGELAGSGRRLVTANGTVQLLKLRSSANLGSYAVQLRPGGKPGEIAGTLRDLEGPLEVDGQLRVNAGGYGLQGHARARGESSAELTEALSMLEPPDAAGRRQFSLEGTF
jgi:general secretion pathway protein N